ncbi:MAG: hypothetical protein K2X82_27190 [Gemmataceae bacterium]|nr:hypothetical protein [Gemmataceae bacterium]
MSNRNTGVVGPLGVGAAVLALAVAGLITAALARPDPPRAGDPAVPEPKVEAQKLIRAAWEADDQRQKTGAALLKLLKSGELDPTTWEDCLGALGDLQYEPAAEYVVEHIATPRVFRGGPLDLRAREPEDLRPAIRVLHQIGHPAVEPLVLAYLKHWQPPGDSGLNLVCYNIQCTLEHPKLRGAAIYMVRERQKNFGRTKQATDEGPASVELLEWLEGLPEPERPARPPRPKR